MEASFDGKNLAPIRRLVSLNTYDCLWIYILRILSDAPVHAYALRSMIEKKFGFRPGMVSAYKVLYLLRQEGYATSKKEGRINLYEITPEGKKILDEAKSFYENQAKLLN